MVGEFGIPDLESRLFARLSTGEQRLVLFVRALVKQPPLLILDEPFQGLDEATIACAARDNFPWMNDVRLKYLLASGLYIRAAGLVVPHITRRIRRCRC